MLIAVEHGHLEMVKLLAGAAPTMMDIVRKNNISPLYVAARQGYLELVKFFVQFRPTMLETLQKPSNVSPLLAACQQRRLEVVRYLLEVKPDIARTLTADGETALHVAAGVGDLDLVKMLVNHEPYIVFVGNRKKVFPIHYAAKGGHHDIVAFLRVQKREEFQIPKEYPSEKDLKEYFKKVEADREEAGREQQRYGRGEGASVEREANRLPEDL